MFPTMLRSPLTYQSSGWRLVYAALDQSQLHAVEAVEDNNDIINRSSDRPASALFAHDDEKIGECNEEEIHEIS